MDIQILSKLIIFQFSHTFSGYVARQHKKRKWRVKGENPNFLFCLRTWFKTEDSTYRCVESTPKTKMESERTENPNFFVLRTMRVFLSVLLVALLVVVEVSSSPRPVYVNSYDNFQQDVGSHVKVRSFFFVAMVGKRDVSHSHLHRLPQRHFAMRREH